MGLRRHLAAATTIGALMFGAPSSAQGQFTYQSGNTAPITIPLMGGASEYPSTISVPTDTNQGIERIVVTLRGLSHTWPNDLDIVLVAPDGTAAAVLMDAGGSADIASLDITIDSEATSTAPAFSVLSGGPFAPTNNNDDSGDDALPAPAPAGPFIGSFAGFFGKPIAGDWSLFIRDDVSPDGGSLVGLSISFYTAPERNHFTSVPLDLSSTFGPNSTYPISLPVTGFGDQVVESVAVELAFNHLFFRDMDVLLVAPNGGSCVLMSDVSHGESLMTSDIVMRFQDGAPALTSPGLIVSGTYAPRDELAGEIYPAPAPAGPHGTSMSTLAGGPANGLWKLYIVDDVDDTQYFPADTLARFVIEINGQPACPGDYDGNGFVDLADLIGFNIDWQPNIGQNCP